MAMLLYDGFDINENGHLTVGGYDTLALAEEFGTPLYVMNEDKIRENCRSFLESFGRYNGGMGKVTYASKALNCKAMCRIAAEEGLCLDVVSGGELYTALQAGFPSERIYFHGNNKTPDEIRYALESEIGCFIVDNLEELKLLQSDAAELGKTAVISLRVKPGIDAHTHDFIRTGQIDSKFGFALETGEALDAAKKAALYPNVLLKGLHCHIGSQIFETDPFVLAAERMATLMAEVHQETGITIEELNLGGGFGIKYIETDRPLPPEYYMELIADAIGHVCTHYNLPLPHLVVEPGRAIVGNAGITLYTIGNIKEIPGIRTYVSVDGGMGDNPRYALYKSDYTAVVANKASQPADETVTIAGKCCESGDLIQENTKIQQAEPGDILAVFSTGAYNYSMASNYNRIPRPALVMVKEGKPYLAVRRESYEDLVRNDL